MFQVTKQRSEDIVSIVEAAIFGNRAPFRVHLVAICTILPESIYKKKRSGEERNLLALRRGLDWLTNILMVIGAIAIILMMLQVTFEAGLRTFFKSTIPGTEEMVSAYYMIASAFLPLAWVQRERGHVIVELFTMWLPPRAAAALDGVVALICATGLGIFAYAGVNKAIAMTIEGEIMIGMIDVVVWPSRWILPAGLCAMFLYMLLHAIGDLVWAAKGGERPFPSATGSSH